MVCCDRRRFRSPREGEALGVAGLDPTLWGSKDSSGVPKASDRFPTLVRYSRQSRPVEERSCAGPRDRCGGRDRERRTLPPRRPVRARLVDADARGIPERGSPTSPASSRSSPPSRASTPSCTWLLRRPSSPHGTTCCATTSPARAMCSKQRGGPAPNDRLRVLEPRSRPLGTRARPGPVFAGRSAEARRVRSRGRTRSTECRRPSARRSVATTRKRSG